MPLCRTSSSVSCEASTETCGEKARNITSRTSLEPPVVAIRPDSAGEGLLTVEPAGEKTDPLIAVLVPVDGVTAPESVGESGLAWVGKEVVEAKRLLREALERWYGSRVTEARGDLAGRVLGKAMGDSESDDCGDCSGSSWAGCIRGEEAYAAAGAWSGGGVVKHRYPLNQPDNSCRGIWSVDAFGCSKMSFENGSRAGHVRRSKVEPR